MQKEGIEVATLDLPLSDVVTHRLLFFERPLTACHNRPSNLKSPAEMLKKNRQA